MTKNARLALYGFATAAILVAPPAVSAHRGDDHRRHVRREIVEGDREIRHERREAAREIAESDSVWEARHEIREGHREISHERRERRREVRRELRKEDWDW